jgi:TPP-dependent trihydroxycyclohexane-1,2-dione (THcHDO) dehydratase
MERASIAGGGVIYSEATNALARFAERSGIPVAETQAGKGSLPYESNAISCRADAAGYLSAPQPSAAGRGGRICSQ